MDWTDESIARLRDLWAEGHSTAEIGRRMAITKNAVVGKAHRLSLSPRPSPIRTAPVARTLELAATGLQSQATVLDEALVPAPPAPVTAPPARIVAAIQPPAAAAAAAAGPAPVAAIPTVPVPVAVPAAAIPAAEAPAAPVRIAVPVERTAPPSNVQMLRPVPVEPVRPVMSEAPRRRGLTCCWPIGEPGTKQFHFCGGDPTPGKPYCAEHAALAYVKIRDRRDSVA